MAEETKKTYTDIEKADAFYDAVMKYKEKIAKTDSGLETFEKSGKYKEYDDKEAKAMEALEGLGTLSDVQKDMVASNKKVSLEHDAREKLLAQKEKYLESVSTLEGQIKIAISKYIVDTEKEIGKLENQKKSYAKLIEEKKAEYEALKSEVEEMEHAAKEEDELILEEKKKDLSYLETKIKSMGDTLASRDKKLAKLTAEFQKNKDKYKDYIELSKKDIAVPAEKDSRAPEAEEEKKEVSKGKKEKANQKVEEEKGKDKKGKATYVPYDESVESPQEQTSKDEEKGKKQKNKEETDKQAFKRIYKDLKKNKSLSVEDTDRMLDILGNKENFDKLNIKTSSVFSFLKSKAEKVYPKLGKELDRQIRASIKDEKLLGELESKQITDWKNICDLGDNKSYNNIAETLDSAMEGLTEEEKKNLLAVKTRYEKYKVSTTKLTEVIRERGEESYQLLNEAPETPVNEAPETPRGNNSELSEKLSAQVLSPDDIEEKPSVESHTVKEKEVTDVGEQLI